MNYTKLHHLTVIQLTCYIHKLLSVVYNVLTDCLLTVLLESITSRIYLVDIHSILLYKFGVHV